MSRNATTESLGPLFAKPKAPPENRHPHSGIALRKLAEEGGILPRKVAIASVLAQQGPLADREVQEILGLRERNGVSPRIGEMRDDRLIAEVGSKKIGRYKSRIVSLTAAGLQWLKEQTG